EHLDLEASSPETPDAEALRDEANSSAPISGDVRRAVTARGLEGRGELEVDPGLILATK
ncbi:unnamed protein product, partial [Effrenium voratum]